MRFAGSNTNINNFLKRRDQYSGTAKSGIAARGLEQEAGINAATNVGKSQFQADAAVQMAEQDGKTMLAQANAQGQAGLVNAGAQALQSFLPSAFSGGFGGGSSGAGFGSGGFGSFGDYSGGLRSGTPYF